GGTDLLSGQCARALARPRRRGGPRRSGGSAPALRRCLRRAPERPVGWPAAARPGAPAPPLPLRFPLEERPPVGSRSREVGLTGADAPQDVGSRAAIARVDRGGRKHFVCRQDVVAVSATQDVNARGTALTTEQQVVRIAAVQRVG